MTRAKFIATACFTALIASTALMHLRAQDSGAAAIEKSILTFSAPIELPRMTLPAGTYVFKRPDANAARIIQVWNEKENHLYGTFLTIPTKRLEVTSENVVTFKERTAAAGIPPAVHYWYYPARETGHEFVYPKDQAMKIAARTGEKVLSTEGEFSENSTVTPVESTSSSSANAEPVTQTAQNNTPAPEVNVNRQSSASTAQVAPQSSSREAVGTAGQDNNATASNKLPKTASPVPLSGLIGFLSFGGAALLRRFRSA